jgi:hypothetical protein
MQIIECRYSGGCPPTRPVGGSQLSFEETLMAPGELRCQAGLRRWGSRRRRRLCPMTGSRPVGSLSLDEIEEELARTERRLGLGRRRSRADQRRGGEG